MRIPASEFKKRRQQIAKIIGEDSIAILRASDLAKRNGDVHYDYRPDSYFYYLTGCNEPDALLVICPEGGEGGDLLFCKAIDPDYIIWNGPMLGLEAACDDLLFDNSFDIKTQHEKIPELMAGRDKVYYMLGKDSQLDQTILSWTQSVQKNKWANSQAPHELISIKPFLDDMRLYKSPNEIKCMKKSAEIAAEAHLRMMKSCQPELHEYNLQAEYAHTLTNQQSLPSYSPIIGGGDNACILHYINNNQKLQDGDLVLIDAGAECDHYASDITRTFPINGKFSKAQKEIYQIVLDAQSAALEKVKPGCHWNEFHDAAVNVIAQGLIDLGILQGSLHEVLLDKSYAEYYMHKTGHWLGLDVHDCGDYSVDGLWVELEAGMVLTVEPGIYISQDSKAPKKYRGIGVRIEDDVVVTKEGHKILSCAVPKTIDEIENLMRNDNESN